MPTNIRDPRSIITPDAFQIRADLLGTPLAGPWRRFWAMMIDLAVIVVLTSLLDSIQLLVWSVVGLFFLRIALQRHGRDAATVAVLLRGFAGCLGVMILLVVSIVGVVVYLNGDGRNAPDGVRTGVDAVAVERGEPGRAGEGAAIAAEAGPDARGQSDTVDKARIREEVDALTGTETVEAWLRLANVPDTVTQDPAEVARMEALRLRLLEEVGGDSLRALQGRLEDLAEDRDDARGEVAELREDLEEEQSGFANLLRDIWEQLGSAIGIWSIYFTVLLTLWQGRTPGKRLVGVRVLRLDGEPMTWWSAFERAGGYIAGLATGLLGFAQIFWDPNRQCIHDKIVGTVVVREGAAGVPGAWREAAGQAGAPDRPGPPSGQRPPDRPQRPPAAPPTREDRP